MTQLSGFAYMTKDGSIDIRTVSPTELGALVNAIVLLSNRRIWPQDYWTRELIDSSFIHASNGNGAIIKVIIRQTL